MATATVEQRVNSKIEPIVHYATTVLSPEKKFIGAIPRSGMKPQRWISLADQAVIRDPLTGVPYSNVTMSETLISMLLLAMKTERPTVYYAAAFHEGAKNDDMPAFDAFASSWEWDEYRHFLPYKSILMELGFGEEDLERRMRDSEGVLFKYLHKLGKKVMDLTTYGVEQEYFTYNWQALIGMILRTMSEIDNPEDPKLSDVYPAQAMNGAVMGRESVHKLVYGMVMQVFLEVEPEYIEYVAEGLDTFVMPGIQVAKEEHAKVPDLVSRFGPNQMHKQTGNFVREFFEVVNLNVHDLGRVVYPYALHNDVMPKKVIGPVRLFGRETGSVDILEVAANVAERHLPDLFYNVVGSRTLAKYGLDPGGTSKYAIAIEDITERLKRQTTESRN